MHRLTLLLLLAAPIPAYPGARQTPPPPAAARERARVDSLRRVMQAHSESIVRARRAAAGPSAKPSRSPLSGASPFYGYNWVFCADLLLGAFVGWLATRLRSRNDPPATRMVWMFVGVLLGAAGAAAVFLTVFVFNAFMSVGFSAMAPALMFGLTLAGIVVAALPLAFSRRRR